MLNCVIDISHYQNPDFVKLRASGVVGVVHKASQGLGYQDPLYQEHRRQALAANFLWGAYHLGDNSDPGEQVKHFFKCAKPDPATLLALQWADLNGGGAPSSSGGELDEGKQEPLSTSSGGGELEEGKQDPVYSTSGGSTMSLEGARKFVTLTAEMNGGIYPGLCSGAVAKREIDTLDPVLAKCWYWLQQYNEHPTDIPRATWQEWTMWQYTDGQNGPAPHEAVGVGPCFRDRYNGNQAGLAKLWGAAGAEHEKAARGLIDMGPIDAGDTSRR
jgi:lysozyme